MDEKRGIGKEDRLPWHLSQDLKRFKAITMGHHLIMGRKTFASIGKPLPGRNMIVVTRNEEYHPEGCLVAYTLEDALSLAEQSGEDEVFIIGGGEIFAQSLDIADRIYLTIVHAEVRADTFFPNLEEEAWIERDVLYHPADEKNQYPFTFKILDRKSM